MNTLQLILSYLPSITTRKNAVSRLPSEENPIENVNNTFHGVGQNLIKYMGIMKYGIWNLSDARAYKIKSFYAQRSERSSDHRIYLAISPSILGTFRDGKTYFGVAFNHFVVNGISFITNYTDGSLNDSRYNDSLLARAPTEISTKHLTGIMIDDEIANKKVSELSILNGVDNVTATVQTIIDFINDNSLFGSQFNKVLRMCSSLRKKNIDPTEEEIIRVNIEKALGEKLQKVFDRLTGIKGATCLQCIQHFNKLGLPIYTNVQELIKQAEENYKKSEFEYTRGETLRATLNSKKFKTGFIKSDNDQMQI